MGDGVAFFFGKVKVSGEKCRHPPPGYGRYLRLRVPTKKSAKPKTQVSTNKQFPPLQTKTNS